MFKDKKYLQIGGRINGGKFAAKGTSAYDIAEKVNAEFLQGGTPIFFNGALQSGAFRHCKLDQEGKTFLVEDKWLGDAPPDHTPTHRKPVVPAPAESGDDGGFEVKPVADAGAIAADSPFGGDDDDQQQPQSEVAKFVMSEGAEPEPPAWELFNLNQLVKDMTSPDPTWRKAIYRAMWEEGDNELLERYFPTSTTVEEAEEAEEEKPHHINTATVEVLQAAGDAVRRGQCPTCGLRDICPTKSFWEEDANLEESGGDDFPEDWVDKETGYLIPCPGHIISEEEEDIAAEEVVEVQSPPPQSHITVEWLKQGDNLERLMDILKVQNPELYRRYRK